MKITDVYNATLAGTQRVRRRTRVEGVEEASNATLPTDQVFFSERSVEVQKARQLALRAPEVREALVDQISSLITQGHYNVTGSDVAPRMIDDHLSIARL